MSQNNISGALTAARAYVQGGWYQSGLTDGCGNYCLRAAISLAAGSMVDLNGEVGYRSYKDQGEAALESYRVDYEANRIVRDFLPQGFDSIPVFNDDPQTTQADVLAVLDKAIASVQ